MEDGIIKEESYQLIEVDPEKYKADEEMATMIQEVSKPYQQKLNRVIGENQNTTNSILHPGNSHG